MVFALNLLYSAILAYHLSKSWKSQRKQNFMKFLILFSPIWIIWLIICGGQYDVGTDYFSYYEIFSNPASQREYFLRKGEWLFIGIIELCSLLKLPPQAFFFIFYSIGFIFLCKTLYILNDRHIWIFIFLYIASSTVFNNQLNALRQCTALYIITYAVIKFHSDKSYKKYLLWILIAGGIHVSSYFALPLCLFFKFVPNKTISYILVICSSLFSVFGDTDIFTQILSRILPDFYLQYLDSDFNRATLTTNLVTKLIWIPFYIHSVHIVRKYPQSDLDIYLYNIGIIAYSLRMIFLGNVIFDRVGMLFLLLGILPLYIYMKTLYQHNRSFLFAVLSVSLLAFYFVKTLIYPSQEYLYHSIYFR